MAGPANRRLRHVAETGRHSCTKDRRCDGAIRIGLTAGASIALIGSSALTGPLLVRNASASSPSGFYAIAGGQPRVGEYVVAWPPAKAARLAAARGYLPDNVPLVKTMIAGPGDKICAKAARVSVNGRVVVVRERADRAGRRLPWWRGCHTLSQDELLLLGLSDPASFDGRYFGPTKVADLIGRASLL